MAETTVSPVELAAVGFDRLKADRERLDRIDRYIRGEHDGPYIPKSATEEYKLLAKRAVFNVLPLLVKTPSQAMAVDGYRRTLEPAEDLDDAEAPETEVPEEWRAWQDQRMDARQVPVHRAALTYGQSFVTVLRDPADPARPVIRGVSPRLMHASYDDPAADALPLWALQVEAMPEKEGAEVRAWLYDRANVYDLMVGGKDGPRLVTQAPHGFDNLCPVVRFAPDIDLEGRVTGVVEPMIPIQDRVNQTVFDLLVSQTFGSFKVRTISGMAPEFKRDPETGEILVDANGRPIPIPIQADASRFLVAPDPDTKFNVLDETPLGGFLEAIELGTKHMAALSQLPPMYLGVGNLTNLSAEAMAAAEMAMSRAVDEYQHFLGESWELVLFLCAVVKGVEPDTGAEVLWKDAGSRSLAQTVDALGKAVQMLKVPARAMWPRIPGVTARDVEEWAQMAEADDPGLKMADAMASAVAPAALTEGSAGGDDA
ncbi:portal protein [Streptomyces phage Attoomi]|uniref:Portal protein n=1 Tax=Streptomyces phage Attoomi TaxID=2059881 RepID=A0A2H5BLC8_9CAUD|nr:portal protein [Streptomyces phage Attoomi]AUG87136.1 portal protein [Streptomyces phage Attoomi]